MQPISVMSRVVPMACSRNSDRVPVEEAGDLAGQPFQHQNTLALTRKPHQPTAARSRLARKVSTM